MTHRISSDGAAAVSIDTFWLPIDKDTPRGVKVLLISQRYGIAQVGVHMASDKFFTHWHPVPRFKKDKK